MTATLRRICVTGASGKAGRAVARDLLEHGYDVTATDIASSISDVEHGAVRADLTDYGQTIEVLTVPSEALAGSPGLIIAAADTVMKRPSTALMNEVFPRVPTTRDVGEFETLLDISRARATIGYDPCHSWRDHISES